MNQLYVILFWVAGLAAAVALSRVGQAVYPSAEGLVSFCLLMCFTFLVYGIRLVLPLLGCHGGSSSSTSTSNKDNREQQRGGSSHGHGEQAVEPTAPEAPKESAEPPSPPTQQQKKTRKPRLYFLDNVKVFLTAVVVTFHVQCGFGACPGAWYLYVGAYQNWFVRVSAMIVGLDQAYFMSMFFFISAYFVPTSYDRKGKEEFLRDKAKRLWVPAMFTSFTTIPLTTFVACVASGSDFVYRPEPGPCWFLFWLLVFNYLYATLREASPLPARSFCCSKDETGPHSENSGDKAVTADAATSGCEEPQDMELAPAGMAGGTPEANGNSQAPETPNERPLPCFWKRWLCGAIICGLLMFAFYKAVGKPSFYNMPLIVGSFANDLFLFGTGVVARRSDWLRTANNEEDPPSPAPLGVAWPWIYLAVLVEIAAIVAIYLQQNNNLEVLLFTIAGIYCVDIILVMLHFFQQWGNTLNRFGAFLADAAYSVYLIHPLVVTGLTAVFVKVYNSMHGMDVIQFDQGTGSTSQLLGAGDGALDLFVGWLIVTIASHLICWPLGWAIKQLPGLRLIL